MATAGRTTKLDDDLTVSAIGFGAGALTSIYGDVDDAESLATLNRCLDLGICHTPLSLPPSGDTVIDTKVRSARSGSQVSWPARAATGSAAGSPVRSAVCRPGLRAR
jgi:hypothetical protein